MEFGAADIAVLAGYFVLVLAIGIWSGRGERSTEDYFLGGRRQHWFLVGLSVLATEVSAMTFLIVPGTSFAEDWWYLQMYFGAFIGKFLVAYVLLPAFYGGRVTTVYEYLGQRFGSRTRVLATLMFFASRLVGSGIRLLAASLAVATLFDWPLLPVVFLGGIVAVGYASFGGIKSIIYTDALQAIVLVGSGVATALFLFHALPGSPSDVLAALADEGKMTVWHGGPNVSGDRLWWLLILHTIVQTMAALGVDQDLTQRMLTCPDLRRGRRSLVFNAVIGFPVPCLFLLIGSLIYAYGRQVAGPAAVAVAETEPREVFARFIAVGIGAAPGLKGLLVAGIFAAAMSSLDSALGALSSSVVTDLYRPYVRPEADNAHYLRVARISSVGFGLMLMAIALMFQHETELLESVFGLVSVVFGGMLGVFLLGVLTRGGTDIGNVVAMLSSVVLLLLIRHGDGTNSLVAWPWFVIIGAGWTVAVGWLFGAVTPGGGGRKSASSSPSMSGS